MEREVRGRQGIVGPRIGAGSRGVPGDSFNRIRIAGAGIEGIDDTVISSHGNKVAGGAGVTIAPTC